jgi:HEAT repeat protein
MAALGDGGAGQLEIGRGGASAAGGTVEFRAAVRGHVVWALREIGSPSASAALAERLQVEDDAWVREEPELALARFT